MGIKEKPALVNKSFLGKKNVEVGVWETGLIVVIGICVNLNTTLKFMLGNRVISKSQLLNVLLFFTVGWDLERLLTRLQFSFPFEETISAWDIMLKHSRIVYFVPRQPNYGFQSWFKVDTLWFSLLVSVDVKYYSCGFMLNTGRDSHNKICACTSKPHVSKSSNCFIYSCFCKMSRTLDILNLVGDYSRHTHPLFMRGSQLQERWLKGKGSKWLDWKRGHLKQHVKWHKLV